MIDDLRIRNLKKKMTDTSLTNDIREKIRMIAWQLTRDPGDKHIVTDDIEVNTILNDLGILTKVEETDENKKIRLKFTIKGINPIPSQHFISDGDDYTYYALLSDGRYWFIGLRYEYEPDPDDEEEEEEEEEEDEEDFEDDNETSYIITDAIIDLTKYHGEELDEILWRSQTKIKGKAGKENLTYEKFMALMKGKPEKKINKELARAIFTGLPLEDVTQSGIYSNSFELFSQMAEIIKIYDAEINGMKPVFNRV